MLALLAKFSYIYKCFNAMVVRCCIYNLVLKYKIKIVIVLIFAFAIVNIVQVLCFQLCLETTTEYADDSIDVVYTWVNGSDSRFLFNMHKYLQINTTTPQDYSNQRFDDKYELKFSLRSLEKYAPWINHVFIVTNGQIPYWLNLDYHKVTVVSHNDIFVDKFDLPTFSSPAIESHLHRIPGLSNRFIYFNDDIFLGKPVFVDDFVSPSHGYFIYLAWPLPMCAIDCPWVYVGDGQCDTSCYNRNCQMDGGDCINYNSKQRLWNGSEFSYKTGSYYHHTNYSSNSSISVKPNNLSISNQRVINQKFLNSHQQLPKISSKVGLVVEPTQTSRLFLQNFTNLTSLVAEHNKQVILHNKLIRRKRKSRRSTKSKTANQFDAYGASLQHTNRIFNIKYGFKARYAPAHSPVMIDKTIMTLMQETFQKEFRKTSRNKFRSDDDMQFAFSYYYFVMNEKNHLSAEEIFDLFDTDASGTWSDREIRTLLTKLYDLPLSYTTVDHFEDLLVNCSKQQDMREVSTPEYERYVDSKLPTVSKELIVNCQTLSKILKRHFSIRHKYKYETISNAQSSRVTFKMLNSNISEVVAHLDEIRRNTKKFTCLNDNMDETQYEENELIRAVLYDFYLSLFPTPSKFELQSDFRNRFLYMDELNQWKSYHFKIKICTYLCIFVLCYLTYCNLLKRRYFYRLLNKLFY